ncbi:MAG: hypothetical protein KBG00_02785 [Rhodoferax sp.]|uniref:hypothetical protein n=1 Tax=Rhodoferax sp. TaxID=50421 RepID=UPI001B3F7F9A|nr:hypothetical protein [Rhodoferax sp.]MBP9147681.1 hypothetical protein [Rhodoferax sp.]MBP9734842.1 hypothetical protein [Rhodoferax sp.]
MDQQLNLQLDQNTPVADAGFRESALKSLDMTPHFKGTTSVFFTVDRMFSGLAERRTPKPRALALYSLNPALGFRPRYATGKTCSCLLFSGDPNDTFQDSFRRCLDSAHWRIVFRTGL